MRYLPHTDNEIQDMLGVIGVPSLDALFEPVPSVARFNGLLNVPAALPEPQLMQHLTELSQMNSGASMLSFLGAGMYAHHIPPAVDQLLLRSEFYTAYTPYQPEVAQGTLQAIWEFQTIVSELFGLPLANASMYDGATAAAEGAQMGRRLTQRTRVLVSECVHPDYRAVIRTYLSGQDPSAYVSVPVTKQGVCDEGAMVAALAPDVAAVVVGYPSFYGGLSELSELASDVHHAGALLVTSTSEPYALALAKPPGSMNVDIATGEGQPLACAPNFGGPGVGLFACRDDRRYLQQLPGRICGETVDKNGQRGFVLTLSTREQHIRRERATSNICTNQGLLALSLAIRVSMLGKLGFIKTAELCLSKARYLHQAILQLPGFSETFPSARSFNEFAIRVRGGDAAHVLQVAAAQGIVLGLNLGRVADTLKDSVLIAVTERHSRADLDRLVSVLSSV
jgi:glycine dehydrogenase subunit 1